MFQKAGSEEVEAGTEDYFSEKLVMMWRENKVILNLCIVKRHFDLLWDKGGNSMVRGRKKEVREELVRRYKGERG